MCTAGVPTGINIEMECRPRQKSLEHSAVFKKYCMCHDNKLGTQYQKTVIKKKSFDKVNDTYQFKTLKQGEKGTVYFMLFCKFLF